MDFRRHRQHLPELLELAGRLLAGLLREPGLLYLVLDLGKLAAFFVADLFLDRLHLLVEKILVLGLLHLPLNAAADALLDLEHGDFTLHQTEHLLQPLGDRRGLQDRLPVGNLEGQVRGDRVGELGRVLDLLDDADYLGPHFLVQPHVALELGGGQAR